MVNKTRAAGAISWVMLVVSLLCCGITAAVSHPMGRMAMAGRSSLVDVARINPIFAALTAMAVLGVAVASVQWVRLRHAAPLWASLFVVWCMLGRALTVEANIGRVRAVWYVFETEVLFDAASPDVLIDFPPPRDVYNVLASTHARSNGLSLRILRPGGRESCAIIGPLVMRRTLDLLAHTGFNVDGYRPPNCIVDCEGRVPPSEVEFLE